MTSKDKAIAFSNGAFDEVDKCIAENSVWYSSR